MASPIAKQWIYATTKIESQFNSQGTGFLVARENVPSDGTGKIFLVTNKHVVHEEKTIRDTAQNLTCYFNIKESVGVGRIAALNVPLRDFDGSPVFREHPDLDVDVLAVDITVWINNHFDTLHVSWITYENFGLMDRLGALDVSVGEEIMVLGYPAIYPTEFQQANTNLPLVRQGILATSLGEILHDTVEDTQGNKRRRALRGFLYDGASIPGSSGSPVILKPVVGRIIGNEIHMSPAPMILLGIVAETRYALIEGTLSLAGLGLAFDAATIKETIELFF